MSQTPLKIIIAGGSLSGLFTGIALKCLGHNVTILERDGLSSSMEHRGAGIILGTDVQTFIRTYIGPLDHFTVTSQFRVHLDKYGQVTETSRSRQVMGSWDIIYHALRAEFDGLESIFQGHRKQIRHQGHGQAKYEFGHKVTGIEDRGTTIEVRTTTSDGQDRVHYADLIIGADGPSSFVRRQIDPLGKRSYGGYVAWRGLVNEGDLLPSTRKIFANNTVFFHGPHTQILAYTIPGSDGQLEEGHRLINWIWYCNSHEGSDQHRDLMTDRHGNLRCFSIPIDGVRPEVWIPQLSKAEEILPPQFSELVGLTAEPFIQSITDVVSSRMTFLEGRALLVGDAAATFRPHTAASTNQGAVHALMLAKVFNGEMTLDEWERTLLDYARKYSTFGIGLGDQSGLGNHGCVLGCCPDSCLLR